jgi:DNA-binding IclR family transcriptional regulator
LLDVIANQSSPVRLVDLSRLTKESRGTVYQRLVTLVAAGWVEQAEPGFYRLSLQVAYAGEAALEQASFGERSSSSLRELVLEVGETASLAVVDGIHARLIQRVEAQVILRAELHIGSLLSLDASSSGRVLTAFMDAKYRSLLKAKGAKLPSETVLEDVRRKGYAISSGKDVPGVRSVAVAIFSRSGTCIAALSIVAPEARFNSDRFLPPLNRAAARLMNTPN